MHYRVYKLILLAFAAVQVAQASASEQAAQSSQVSKVSKSSKVSQALQVSKVSRSSKSSQTSSVTRSSSSVQIDQSTTLEKRTQEYEQRLKKQPEHLALRQRLADLYARLKKPDKVINTLAPYANEISLPHYKLLAEAYQNQKNYKKAIQTWQMIIKKQQPPSFRSYFALAQVYEKNNQLLEAEQQYKKAIQTGPKHLPSFNALFDLYFKQEDYGAAKTLVLEKVALLGERKDFLHKLCAVYTEDSFVQEGVKTCTKAIKAQNSYPDSHIYLARSLTALNQEVQAEKIMTQTARQFSSSEFVQWSVGEYFYQKQQYVVAARYLQKAVQIKPQSARSLLALAVALLQAEKYTQALPVYLKACQNDKTRSSLIELRTAIAHLHQNNKPTMAKKFTLQEHKCQK